MLVLTGPEHGLGHNLFEIIRATLISSQVISSLQCLKFYLSALDCIYLYFCSPFKGLFVSLLLCFLNSEVRQTLQYWPQRWRQRRGLCSPSGRHRLMSASSDMQRLVKRTKRLNLSNKLVKINGSIFLTEEELCPKTTLRAHEPRV